MTAVILILLTGTTGGAWYTWTGHIRRTRPCRHCAGWGYRERGGILGRTASRCRKCGGTGQSFRLAARHVQRKRARRAGRARRAADTW
jgi:DnaJ-class molecular chaperone